MYSRFSLAAAILSVAFFAASSTAGTIANWKVLSGSPTSTADLNTDGPTFGDGSAGDANALTIAGRFGTVGTPENVTLSIGETLTVSGSIVLTGGTDNLDQYRFGVFNDGGQFDLDDETGWTGGWMY